MFRTAFLLISFAASIFGSSLSFTPTNPSPTAGNPFELVVELTADEVIAGYQFDLLFTPNLQVVAITQTGFFLTEGLGLAWSAIDNANGVVTYLNDVTVGGGGVTGADSLMRIEFLPTAVGTATVNFDNLLAINDNFDIVVPTAQSLTFLVEAAPPAAETPEPGSLILTGAAILALTIRRKFAIQSASGWRKTA